VGFYLAFMPLYFLGTMGMPRRLEHYDNPAWQPFLIVAFLGACCILIGIVLLAIQLFVSIRQRNQNRDLTGDPWDGRTLEWATSSPPAPYNFAVIPRVSSRDAFLEVKADRDSGANAAEYESIHMPRNSGTGVILGALAFVLGFAVVWHIWWLAVTALLGIVVSVVLRSFDRDTSYTISAATVADRERERPWLPQNPSAGQPL
jgi:cytochrome o ubiquinol oxidase subunit 1